MKSSIAVLTRLATVAGVTGLSAMAMATPITITNHSFENHVLTPGGFEFGIAGWNHIGGTTGGCGTSGSVGATGVDGNNVVILWGADSTFGQDVTVGATETDWGATSLSLQPNTQYTITFAAGGRGDAYVHEDGAAVTAYLYSSASFSSGHPWDDPDATVQSAVSAAGLLGNNVLSDFSGSFTTGNSASGNLYIMFRSANAGSSQVLVDNVRLDVAPVPEPISLALPALGGLMILVRRRRQ